MRRCSRRRRWWPSRRQRRFQARKPSIAAPAAAVRFQTKPMQVAPAAVPGSWGGNVQPRGPTSMPPAVSRPVAPVTPAVTAVPPAVRPANRPAPTYSSGTWGASGSTSPQAPVSVAPRVEPRAPQGSVQNRAELPPRTYSPQPSLAPAQQRSVPPAVQSPPVTHAPPAARAQPAAPVAPRSAPPAVHRAAAVIRADSASAACTRAAGSGCGATGGRCAASTEKCSAGAEARAAQRRREADGPALIARLYRSALSLT